MELNPGDKLVVVTARDIEYFGRVGMAKPKSQGWETQTVHFGGVGVQLYPKDFREVDFRDVIEVVSVRDRFEVGTFVTWGYGAYASKVVCDDWNGLSLEDDRGRVDCWQYPSRPTGLRIVEGMTEPGPINKEKNCASL